MRIAVHCELSILFPFPKDKTCVIGLSLTHTVKLPPPVWPRYLTIPPEQTFPKLLDLKNRDVL